MKKKIILLLACLSFINVCGAEPLKEYSIAPPRSNGQKSVLKLAVDPIPIVKIGVIGLGKRGENLISFLCRTKGAEIVAICDMEAYNIEATQNTLQYYSKEKAVEYIGDENTWKKLCERDDIDVVYICTDWRNHVPMAVYAMEQGRHVAIEVPAAMTVNGCWKLVDTAEKMQKHCTILENCCYDLFELATLNMAQQGVFGDIYHAEGAYIHKLTTLTLRNRLKPEANYRQGVEGSAEQTRKGMGYYNSWRADYNAEHDGNLYPTHGLGPICQVLNIHRGDKMNHLVSMSTPQYGLTKYAKETFGEDSPEAGREYKNGDMNTTLIQTEKGKTIMIQHDVTSPRPYSRIHLLSGTEGYVQKYPIQQIAINPQYYTSLSAEEIEKTLGEYEFPFVKSQKTVTDKMHPGVRMEYYMNYRLIYCLQNGLPLDIDVYDAAEWSCLVELTEQSINKGNQPIEIPDFTRGEWNKVNGFKHEYQD